MWKMPGEESPEGERQRSDQTAHARPRQRARQRIPAKRGPEDVQRKLDLHPVVGEEGAACQQMHRHVWRVEERRQRIGNDWIAAEDVGRPPRRFAGSKRPMDERLEHVVLVNQVIGDEVVAGDEDRPEKH